MKPYILDDTSTLEYKRLDLMSKILDPWTRGYLTALGVGAGLAVPGARQRQRQHRRVALLTRSAPRGA